MNLRRKRLRLMRDTQWRGYARTAEGNPITLSQVRSMANLSVLGNSAQSGTPSPDNPVEVVGTGVRTGNLFDISQITNKTDGYVDNNKLYVEGYSFPTDISPQKFLEMTGLQIGDTFTCRTQYTQIKNFTTGAKYANFIPKRSGLIGLILFDYGSSSDRNNGFRVSTIPSDFNNDNYYGLYFYGGSGETAEGEVRAIWSNFAIYKGSYTAETLPPYEPYGYKVAVQASGRNLFNLTDVLNSNGYIDSDYTKSIAITPFHVIEGEKYVLITKGNQLNNDQYSSIYFGESDLKYPTGNTKIIGTKSLYLAFENNVEKRYIMTATKTCDITHFMVHGAGLWKNAYNVEELGVYEYTDDYDTIPYEPYGYKVPATASGQNLLNNNDVLWTDGYYINSNGLIVENTYSYFDCAYSNVIKVKAMADYTLGVLKSVNSQLATYNRIFECDSNGDNMVEITHVNSNLQNSTLNFQSQTGYVRFSVTREVNTTIDDMTDNLMLLNGTYTAYTIPQYEPYKEPQTFNVYTPEQLHGVGDAHDSVVLDFDNKTAKLYQKTNIKQYTSAVKNREIRGDYCLYYLDTDTDKKQMIQCKCNLFESTYAMTGDINSVFLSQYNAHPTLLISIEKNIIGYDDTTDDINSGRIKLDNWLLQKQMEGTPLTVTYALADDYITTTDITALQQWDSLPNLKGTWILTANGGTEPTLRAEYYSEERSTSTE